MKINRRTWMQISSTTLIRMISNTGFRMVFPFQSIFMDGFGISLLGITRMYAGQSLVGIFSPFIASLADTRGRRIGMLSGMVLFSLGTLVIVFLPTSLGFLLFLLLSMLGKSIFDPSLQAYFGDVIPYNRRGFVLGLTEVSWSLAFFMGVPVVGYLMRQFGLMAPFIALAALGMLSFLVVLYLIPADPESGMRNKSILSNFNLVLQSGSVLAGFGTIVLICWANQLVNAVFGVWLNKAYALKITALGGASAVIGIAELLGEGGVSLLSDRTSKQKAILLGIVGNILAAAALPVLGKSVWGAFLGLFVFYLTFEFSIVTVIPLMTGVLPQARATVMALTIASANIGRGFGSLIAGPLFMGGFWGNAIGAAVVNLLAIAALRFVEVAEDN
jgi:predicted MFS family arabinose efflux permease